VNIGSVAGRFAFKGRLSTAEPNSRYVPFQTASLRREVIEYGVRVTDIEPGAVATVADSIKHEATKGVIGRSGLYAPDANILQAEDIASAILYVVSQPEHVNVSELLIRVSRNSKPYKCRTDSREVTIAPGQWSPLKSNLTRRTAWNSVGSGSKARGCGDQGTWYIEGGARARAVSAARGLDLGMTISTPPRCTALLSSR